MTPKKTALTERPVPIRIDPPTRTNLETIKASGLAKDDSAAFRAAAAALAHGLVQPPVVKELVAALQELIKAMDRTQNTDDQVVLGALTRARAVVGRAKEQKL